MSLWEAILGATFGRNSSRPVRAACLRLGGVLAAAGGVSWLLSKGVAEVPTAPIPNQIYLTLIGAVAMQAIVLFALLAAMGVIHATNASALTGLLIVLPLTTLQRWLAFLLPGIVVATAAAMAAAWPLGALLVKLGANPLVVCLSSLGGLLAALGIIHGIPRKQSWLLLIGLPLLMYGEYRLLGAAAGGTIGSTLALMLLCLVFVGCWFLLLRSCTSLSHDSTAIGRSGRLHGTTLPGWLWFYKKVIRSSTTQVGLLATAGMSVMLFFVLKSYEPEPQVYALLAAILSAAFASDIRSLCRRNRPAEITALRATVRFVLSYSVIASLYCLAAVAPLIVGMVGAAGTVNEYLHAAGQLGLGIAIGIGAGTVTSPAPRDVLGQLVATLSCTAILVALPFAPGIRSLPTNTLTLFEVLLISILLCLAFAIELHRNYYLWRNPHE